VGNESSGDPNARRFEPAEFAKLAMVVAGREAHFGAIGAQDLAAVLSKAGINSDPLRAVAGKFLDLATSWGPTQVMGYQTIPLGRPVSDLLALPSHFQICTRILLAFMRQWQTRFDEARSIENRQEMLFRCWDTGEPDGKTADPEYCTKGMARMQLYGALA
jgi:hypothetical protein